jgi:type VI secretion system protein
MSERRLLERLSYWEQGARRTNRPEQDILVASVTDYLIRILNTRQGTALIDAKFGVPDFTNFGGGGLEQGTLTDVSNEIARMISRYEPRLKDVRVHLEPSQSSAMSISFGVVGHMLLDNVKVPLRLGAELGSNGRIRMR